VAGFFAAPWQVQVAVAAMFLALAISVVTDLRQRLIYDIVWMPALAVALGLFLWLGGWPLLVESLTGVAFCAGPMLIGNLIRFRGKRAMARGDLNLMTIPGAVSGGLVGWPFSITVLVYVAIAGGLQAVLWLLFSKLLGRPRPDYIPYGVAIAAGTLAAFVFPTSFV
jgi:hypothetical protein